jgi:hypothetical protein
MDVYFSLITSWFYELLLLLLLETERESEWGSLLSTQKKKRGKWHGSFIPLFLSSARLRVSSLSQHDWPPCFSFPNLFKWLYLSSSSLSIVLFSLPLQFNNTKTFCVGRKYIIFTFRVGGGSMCTCNCQMDAPDVAICRASFSTHKKKRKKKQDSRVVFLFDSLIELDRYQHVTNSQTISPSC